MVRSASAKRSLLGAVLAVMWAFSLANAAQAGTTTYVYDSLGRVVTVTDSNGIRTTYTYDLAGNRSTQSTSPAAVASTFVVDENSSNNRLVPTIIGPSASGVAVVLGSGPTNGQVTVSGTSFLYTPNTRFYGSDSFQFTANNGGVPSPPALISITVNLIKPTTTAYTEPAVATNSTNNVFDLSGLIGGGQPAGIQITSGLSSGASGPVVNGLKVTYTPPQGFQGTDSFQYVAYNAAGQSSSATITIPVNHSIGIWGQFVWGQANW